MQTAIDIQRAAEKQRSCRCGLELYVYRRMAVLLNFESRDDFEAEQQRTRWEEEKGVADAVEHRSRLVVGKIAAGEPKKEIKRPKRSR